MTLAILIRDPRAAVAHRGIAGDAHAEGGGGGGVIATLTRPLLPKTCSTSWLPISKAVMNIAKRWRFEQEHGSIQEL